MPETIAIPAQVASHVLHHFSHEGGFPAGGFTQALLTAIGIADEQNLSRLAAGFPEYVAAVNVISYEPNGIARLQQIAAGR